MTPAPARSRRNAQPGRTIAPRGPRRVSGPVSRRMVAAPAGGAAALPRRGTTGLFARVRALPEHRVVDRLLRSRLWIWVLGALLGGIVGQSFGLTAVFVTAAVIHGLLLFSRLILNDQFMAEVEEQARANVAAQTQG